MTIAFKLNQLCRHFTIFFRFQNNGYFETMGMMTYVNHHAHCLREALGDYMSSLSCSFSKLLLLI